MWWVNTAEGTDRRGQEEKDDGVKVGEEEEGGGEGSVKRGEGEGTRRRRRSLIENLEGLEEELEEELVMVQCSMRGS
jgi:hypothetical protein